MRRVYLDWCTYNNLRKFGSDRSPYKEIYDLITNNDLKILVPFSPTHIQELHKSGIDNQEINESQQKDLDFVISLSGNKCITLDKSKNFVSCQTSSPRDHFTYYSSQSRELLGVDDVFGLGDSPEVDALGKQLIALLKSTSTGIDFDSMDSHFKDSPELLSVFEKTRTDNTMYGLMQDVFALLNQPEKMGKVYRALTATSTTALNMNTDPNQWRNPFEYLDKVYKKTFNGKSFLDSVLNDPSSNKRKNRKDPNRFDQFISMYSGLDAHGFHRDKVLQNMVYDATHAFYGAHCDVFVTDDRRALEKTRAVYEKCNIETFVFTPEELSVYLVQTISTNSPEAQNGFLKRISESISGNYPLLKSFDDDEHPVSIYSLKSDLLGFFDRIQSTEFEDHYRLFLYKKRPYYHSGWFWEEVVSVTNQLASHLGVDFYDKEEFLEIEKSSFSDDKGWPGRTWVIDNALLQLYFNKHLDCPTFTIDFGKK